MKVHPLLSPHSREEAARAVADVEAMTSAEIVISVRGACDAYTAASLTCGSLAALVTMLLVIFLPASFPTFTLPLDTLVAFGLFAWLCTRSVHLRRLATTARDRSARVRAAARVAFVDMGISRTRGRTGVLIFVALFERKVEVVADVGVPVDTIQSWRKACDALETAVLNERPSAELFAAVRAFGPLLGSVMPRAVDDVNELPDEMVAS